MAFPLPDGRSALMTAAEDGRAELVALLLERGADLEQASISGATMQRTSLSVSFFSGV